MQFDVESLKPSKRGSADTTRSDRADAHALNVVRTRDAIGNIPAPVDSLLVGGQIISHQRQNHHYDMFGDADAVAVGDLGDRDAVLHRRLQIDVI